MATAAMSESPPKAARYQSQRECDLDEWDGHPEPIQRLARQPERHW